MHDKRSVAYFSMEIGLETGIHTYSGGLGILAGDTLRSMADLEVPVVAMTLVHHKGYFKQELAKDGTQSELPAAWVQKDFCELMKPRVKVRIEDRDVHIQAWKYDVVGQTGYKLPVYFLDADLPENDKRDRTLTDHLYGGDSYYRICQEVVLGMGGIRMLHALGYDSIARYHMNEGHAAFLTLRLFTWRLEQNGHRKITDADIEAVRDMCVFTTHTPVPAGHDAFDMKLVKKVLGDHPILEREELYLHEKLLNMTCLALNCSHYCNGVARKHAEVSRRMFPGYKIDSITNGVHAPSWTSTAFQDLYDRHIPGWRTDNLGLRNAFRIPPEEIWQAHMRTKRELLDYVKRATGVALNEDVLTLGFARRAATYKRADLLFTDVDRLQEIAERRGPLQVVYAGKAHPHDKMGKALIKKVFDAKNKLKNNITVVYLENYDIPLGKLITTGVDIWLNNPIAPLEASGTSGMKSALNGVPSFSILDGWWIEGCIEGVTGWAIGDLTEAGEDEDRYEEDSKELYKKLDEAVMPIFYKQREDFIRMMTHAISLNGPYFNTERMVREYVVKAYFK